MRRKMLTSASDYKFVNATPAAGMINGNILPVTHPAGNPAPMYFEDYLFLLEAFYERMNPESAGLQNISVPIRTLNGGNIRALDITTSGLYNGTVIVGPIVSRFGYRADYINKSTSVPTSDVKIGYSNKIHLGDYLQNYTLIAPETRQPYSAMRPRSSPYSILFGEYVRCKFWAFDNMCRLLVPIAFIDFATSMTGTYYTESGSVDSYRNINLNTSYLNSYQFYTSGRNGIYLRYKIDSITYRTSFFTFPYAKSAKLIYSGTVYSYGEDNQRDGAYIWTYIDLTVGNGGDIIVPTDVLETMSSRMISLGVKNNAAVSFETPQLLVDFEFPARLDGVNWNWQPSFTSTS